LPGWRPEVEDDLDDLDDLDDEDAVEGSGA
jgi:hypothetical protein